MHLVIIMKIVTISHFIEKETILHLITNSMAYLHHPVIKVAYLLARMLSVSARVVFIDKKVFSKCNL